MILIYFITIVVIIEIFVFAIYVWIKKDFKWIISDKDSYPNFTKDQILKYNNDVFNKDLGWDNNKKSKRDKLSVGKYIDYNFDNKGSRITKNKFILSDTVLFGDSYCMSRYSDDNDTIQFFLEKIIKKKIPNYGVGNYGLDQVFIKIKLTSLKKIKKVVIIFVPETILRIQSYWKHFLEFGNTFGFKPKFILKKNKLILKKEHIKKIKKQGLKKNIDKLKNYDYFYENKFKKYSFAFPFIFSFCKNFEENIKIFFYLILFKLSKNNFFYNKAFDQIILRNIVESQKYYKNNEFTLLLKKILFEINTYLKKKNIKPSFVIVPQYLDIKLFGKKSNSSLFFKKLSKLQEINLFDLTEEIIKHNKYDELYINDNFGGHLNKVGNKFVARKIIKKFEMKEKK